MSPEEVNNQSLRVRMEAHPNQEATTKDLLEEAREKAMENLERYYRETAPWCNKKTKPPRFPNGLLVL